VLLVLHHEHVISGDIHSLYGYFQKIAGAYAECFLQYGWAIYVFVADMAS
jgi:hypothetical protein